MQNSLQKYPKDKQKLLERVKELCQSAYPKHNWDGHLIPVVNSALRLQESYGGDRFIVEAGAYMHDLGRVLFDYLKVIGITHDISGYYYTRLKLWQYGFDKKLNNRISKCVLEHSGSGILKHKPTSLEAEIVMNADAIAAFEGWNYQFSISYFSHGRDTEKTKQWLFKKLDSSWKKLTLTGVRETISPLYKTIKQELAKTR